MGQLMEKQFKRTAFIRQPARILFVDYSPPFDQDTCEYLSGSLLDFFLLVTHLSGPCRTPFFGLFVLASYPESLFSLQHVRGNFPRLHSAIEELKLLCKENCTKPCSTEVILQGLNEATAQFKRQAQSLRQMSTSSCQLEIFLFTCRSAASMSKHIEKFAKTLDLENLKKIQVVAVQSSDELNLAEDDSRSGYGMLDFSSTFQLQRPFGHKVLSASQEITEDLITALPQISAHSPDGSSPDSVEDGLLSCGLVDVVFLEKDVLSFRNFFKSWLIDCSTDQEHLRIFLPSVFTPDSGSEESQESSDKSLILKCDLHERLLDPLHLPYQSHFTVCSESATLTSKGVAATKPNVLTYPMYNLNAVKLIKADAICESVLFGMPYIVRPTLCWRLDWEELESNQQHFQALCSILKQRDIVLLVKTKRDTITSSGRQLPSPQGHFLLLPSENKSLLLKSIAVSELMLPSDVQTPAEGPSDSALSVVASCLDQVDLASSFNPLLVHSGLYKCLISQSLKSTAAGKPVKRRFHAPQKNQTADTATNNSHANSQQTKKVGSRSQVRRVVFTAPKDTPQPLTQTEFRSANLVLSATKRFRSTSAADLYNSNPPSFPDSL